MLEIPITAKVMPFILAGWMMLTNVIPTQPLPANYHIEKDRNQYEIIQKEENAEIIVFINREGMHTIIVNWDHESIDWEKDKNHRKDVDFLDYIPNGKEKAAAQRWFEREKNSKEGLFNEIEKEYKKNIKQRGN